ncbi:hypothetical protein MAPG_04787 [Magnaporthiopsis poae ATCC 64411]|uniref:SGNH hydrolase-type esterase domain-containing protein n=1 Tax=Magnaporthiopsis poae (strain ATCC 64411 / 73-15) TaxID=644358 RepID=A0A0C4DXN3_MAGP6|nr:hypothetical protein MAPG_04787 [Magnaporthiopsis poae ATCC 64411]
MMMISNPLSLLVRGGIAALLLSAQSSAASSIQSPASISLNPRQGASAENRWVAIWTSMPQQVEPDNLPPAPYRSSPVLRNATLRQTLHMSSGAERIRIQISNTFGGSDLTITAASVALPTGGKAGVGRVDNSTLKPLTFDGGKASVTVPRGKVAYSDGIDFKVAVEAWASPDDIAGALVILGDSITDGRGSTDDANNRWPDLLLARMRNASAADGLGKISVVNQAAGGNAVLAGGLGPTLLTRYRRDALQVAGARYVLLFEGVNDIGNSGSDVSGRLQSAFTQIAKDCRQAGLVVLAATITPFGGQGQAYSSPARDQMRVRFNQWVLASKGTVFDGVVDLAKMVADPRDASKLLAAYDSGDHLHLSVAGYQHMADQFPLEVFKLKPKTGAI